MVLHQIENEMLARYRGCLGNPTPEGLLFKRENFREAHFVDDAHVLLSDSLEQVRELHKALELPLASEATVKTPKGA